MSDEVLTTLRIQAWQRAKAELEAVRATYWGTVKNDEHELKCFQEFTRSMDAFIREVEDHGWTD